MKKIILLNVFCFLVVFVANAQQQKVTLKLMNATTLQPIEGVSLKSYLDKNIHLLSDQYGHITLQLIDNDTLIFSKDYFHPLYLFVKLKNFDSTHVLAVNMLPSKEIHEPLKGNFSSLADFDYHFVHDQLGDDSHLKVKGFEHESAAQVRYDMMHSKKNQGIIHITPVLHHQNSGTNQYKLKDE
jgi:hypothetical protein